MGAMESKLLHLKVRFKSKLSRPPHVPKLKWYPKAVTREEDDYCYGDHLGLLDGCYGRSDASPPCKFPVSSEDGFESEGDRGIDADTYEPLNLDGPWYKRHGWLE